MKNWRFHTLMLQMLILIPNLAFCSAGNRKALVIGNDDYPGNKLFNARNDAQAIADQLAALGYQTTLSLDVDRHSMARSIDTFAASLNAGDTAVVYYAGHGLQVEGENYLVPTDFRISQEADVQSQGYSLHALLQTLTVHGATTEIVILDACRNNPFIGSRSLGGGGWAATAISAGTFLAFGTAPGSTAEDNPGQHHGLFTQSLLKYLSSSSEIDQMFQNVRLAVIQQSGGKQIPWTSSSLVGSFHLNPTDDAGAPSLPNFSLNASQLMGSDRTLIQRSLAPTGTALDSDGVDDGQALNEAYSAARSMHFEKALSIVKTILSVDPRCAQAFRLLGIIAGLTGRSEDANQALDRAIEINPGDGVAYSYRCLLKASQGAAASEADCREAVLLRGDLSDAHLGLSLSLASSDRKVEAYEEARRAAALDPESLASLSLLSELSRANTGEAVSQNALSQAIAVRVGKTE